MNAKRSARGQLKRGNQKNIFPPSFIDPVYKISKEGHMTIKSKNNQSHSIFEERF